MLLILELRFLVLRLEPTSDLLTWWVLRRHLLLVPPVRHRIHLLIWCTGVGDIHLTILLSLVVLLSLSRLDLLLVGSSLLRHFILLQSL